MVGLFCLLPLFFSTFGKRVSYICVFKLFSVPEYVLEQLLILLPLPPKGWEYSLGIECPVECWVGKSGPSASWMVGGNATDWAMSPALENSVFSRLNEHGRWYMWSKWSLTSDPQHAWTPLLALLWLMLLHCYHTFPLETLLFPCFLVLPSSQVLTFFKNWITFLFINF